MVAGTDLYRSAWVLMKQHGVERALEICAEREDAMGKADDVMGAVAWHHARDRRTEREAEAGRADELSHMMAACHD